METLCTIAAVIVCIIVGYLCYTIWRIYNDKNIDNDYNDWINE